MVSTPTWGCMISKDHTHNYCTFSELVSLFAWVLHGNREERRHWGPSPKKKSHTTAGRIGGGRRELFAGLDDSLLDDEEKSRSLVPREDRTKPQR